jgi:CheY-like chemotaxis protein/anti-sigma regulatory factor (Ser/Thr protein kinase)
MFRELAEHKGLALSVETDAGVPPALSGDGGKVRQVLINLISNAVKFTERGRIAVRASARPAAGGRYAVTITVTDSGPGIEPANLTRIFDAFEQADSRSRAGGTGLGLAISRGFARLMGGDLVVESAPAEGSVFTLTLEAGAAAAEGVPVRPVHPVPAGLDPRQPPPKVLIVDDVSTNRDLLDELLSRLGFATRVAASADEAFTAYDDWRPDLLLMDLRMPGTSGLDAIRRLRQQGVPAAIIAVTASGLAGTEREARAAGADAFVRKPYREGDLLATIGEQLRIGYVYETPAPPAPEGEAHPSLAQGLSGLPPALIEQLREAALQGRARRLESIADQVRVHSQAVSAEIRTLARSFQYDVLVGALPARGRDDA